MLEKGSCCMDGIVARPLGSFHIMVHPICMVNNDTQVQLEESDMKRNMGPVDRGIRILAAIVIAVLYFTNQITGIAAIILGIFAVVFLLTSFVAFCPLYALFKFSTRKEAKA